MFRAVIMTILGVDDYFNNLTTGNVMRPVTDGHKISRAKLAYMCDATDDVAGGQVVEVVVHAQDDGQDEGGKQGAGLGPTAPSGPWYPLWLPSFSRSSPRKSIRPCSSASSPDFCSRRTSILSTHSSCSQNFFVRAEFILSPPL